MPNPNRIVDKTFLSANNADERVIRHRDLISHAFRWANVARYLAKNHNYMDAIVLDCGCGREVPVARMLYSNRLIPKKYVGVDMNKFDIPDMLKGKKLPISIWEETDICALDPEDVGLQDGSWEGTNIQDLGLAPGDTDMQGAYYGKDGKIYSLPNVLVCYEMLEHILPSAVRKTLIRWKQLTSTNCHYFVSTPSWDHVNAAANHIGELDPRALGALFEDLGYHIDGMWGTFASQKDYKPIMEERFPGITAIFDKLSEYYDSTVMSTTFAPLFPMESRNILWHLTKKTGDAAKQERLFSSLEACPTPWSQHPNWRDLAG